LGRHASFHDLCDPGTRSSSWVHEMESAYLGRLCRRSSTCTRREAPRLYCLYQYDPKLTSTQLLAFSMWAFLFSALKNGLGKSYSILEDAEISKTQEVSRRSLFYLYLVTYADMR